MEDASPHGLQIAGVVTASGEAPIFWPGEHVKVAQRFLIGHCRVSLHLRGKAGVLDFHKITNTEEKRRGVEALGVLLFDQLGCYERWLTTFATILFQKGILTPTEPA